MNSDLNFTKLFCLCHVSVGIRKLYDCEVELTSVCYLFLDFFRASLQVMCNTKSTYAKGNIFVKQVIWTMLGILRLQTVLFRTSFHVSDDKLHLQIWKSLAPSCVLTRHDISLSPNSILGLGVLFSLLY